MRVIAGVCWPHEHISQQSINMAPLPLMITIESSDRSITKYSMPSPFLSSSVNTSLSGIWSGNPAFQNLRYSGEAFWAHPLQNLGCCDCSGVWKSFKKSADSKPMVSMAMCNVDGFQVSTSSCNPIC